jgi:hypothetical protein
MRVTAVILESWGGVKQNIVIAVLQGTCLVPQSQHLSVAKSVRWRIVSHFDCGWFDLNVLHDLRGLLGKVRSCALTSPIGSIRLRLEYARMKKSVAAKAKADCPASFYADMSSRGPESPFERAKYLCLTLSRWHAVKIQPAVPAIVVQLAHTTHAQVFTPGQPVYNAVVWHLLLQQFLTCR